MKKFMLNILLILIVPYSFGQFHEFYKANGFILSQGASITHIARAGGGVVLKGVAKPKYPDSLSVFTNITFDEAKGLSTMHIQTQTMNISFSDSSWLMRDAAMLVKSEKDTMYRDVNLLGEFTDDDYNKGYDELYPSRKFYNIEMADSLRKTKSGQTLIYMDIILAGISNTKYYSNNNEAFEKYLASKDSLLMMVNEYNDSIEDLRYKSVNDTYLKLINFDSLKKSGKLKTREIAFFDKIRHYSLYYLFKNKSLYEFSYYNDTIRSYSAEIDSLFNQDYSELADLKYSWNDYTYNDEYTNYTFYFTENMQHLIIDGEPNYTFLYHKQTYFEDDVEVVDSLFTNYYIQHPDLIKNLNYIVVTNAEHFGKIAAFYRYLKNEYPKLWNLVCSHYSRIKKIKGDTPRFIGRDPSNED